MAAGRRHRPQRRLPGGPADPPPLGLLGRLREGSHHRRAWVGSAPAAGRVRRRRGASRPHEPGRRGQRGLPPGGGPCSGPRSGRPLLPDVCLVQRPGRQRVAAPGDQDAASGPRVGGPHHGHLCPGRPAPRNGPASRSIREEPCPAQLVGLVCRVLPRARAGADARRGIAGRGSLHGRNPARCGPVMATGSAMGISQADLLGFSIGRSQVGGAPVNRSVRASS